MSVLSEYPDQINHEKDVQIWNNAVFDSDNQIKSPSWFAKKPPASSDSLDSSKENRSPLHQSKPLNNNIPIHLEEKTDEEIEIEKEISRLYAKLDSIRRNKTERRKQGETGDVDKKIQESGFSKVQRRGFSLGPNEIMSNSKSKQTPVQSTQNNRRKSCFWKLEDIEEEKTRGGKKNSSLRQAVTTVGSKKGVKKDELILASIQPKKLFGEQSVVGVKKPLKPGRVIPSRYNQATVNSSMKKRSFTDNNNGDRKSLTEVRVKKKWDIPSEIVVPKRLDLDDNEDGIDVAMPVVLPRIRAVRVVDETGRDSGPAKRVAQLVGKKSYFALEDEETVCQTLSFIDE